MSKPSASAPLLYTGLGVGLLLALGGALWPEARALGLGLGALAAFLGFIAQRLPMEFAREIQALGDRLQSGLVEGLREQGAKVGESLGQNLKASVQDLQAALATMKEQVAAHQREFAINLQSNSAAAESHWAQLQKQASMQGQTLSDAAKAQYESLASHWKAQQDVLASQWKDQGEAWLRQTEKVLEGQGLSAQSLQTAAATVVRSHQEALSAAAMELKGVLAELQSSLHAQSEQMQAGSSSVAKNLQAAAEKLSDMETRQMQAMALAGDAVKASAEAASQVLAEQGALLRKSGEAIHQMADFTGKSQASLQQFESASQVNQAEMQAGIAMLNSALGNLLDRLEAQAQSGESQEAFLGKLEAALAAYQERSGEILSENALKTQEILMEALQVLENRQSPLLSATDTGL